MRGNRKALGFDAGMGHFGIALGGGFMFEFAQYMDKNDLDMVFVLNPAPFIGAGLDTEKLEKWRYAEIEMMDDRGGTFKEHKLVRIFDLK
jgi:hypothetical protein